MRVSFQRRLHAQAFNDRSVVLAKKDKSFRASRFPLHAAANGLTVPCLPPKHLARRAFVQADVLLHNADASSTTTARVDGANLVGTTVGTGRASSVTAQGGWQDASTCAFRRGDAQTSTAITAPDVVAAS